MLEMATVYADIIFLQRIIPDPDNFKMITVEFKRGWFYPQGYFKRLYQHTVLQDNEDGLEQYEEADMIASDKLYNVLQKMKGEQWALVDLAMTKNIYEIIQDILTGQQLE